MGADGRARLLVVAGPTASGKSDLAIRLAGRLSGEIVNIDAVQLYRGLDIGTAKVSAAERAAAAHHLLDILDPDQGSNAGDFLRRAQTEIAEITARGKLPLCVGGSTMYVASLLHGLAPLPTAQPELRAALEAEGVEALYARLMELDAASAARLHRHDRKRITRALESVLAGGVKASDMYAGHKERLYDALILVLCWPREKLYRRIDQRAETMVAAGLIEETRRAMESFGASAPALQSVGYHEALQHLRGELPLADLPAAIAQATRRLAKRQLTFWRNEPLKRGWRVRPAPGEGQPLRSAVEQLAMRRPVKDFNVLPLNFAELVHAARQGLDDPHAGSELWYLAAEELLRGSC